MTALLRTITKWLTDYDNPRSIGVRFRIRRIGPLLGLIDSAYEKYGHVNIIDVGGTKTYWKILPKRLFSDKKMTITVVNLSGVITVPDDRHFKFVEMDGCDLSSYADNSFHIAHSNSVLEHVGSWDKMLRFAAEISRVARSYFVQTPYYWCPLEPHFMVPFFHWLPRTVRISLIRKFALGHSPRRRNYDDAAACIDSINLLDKKRFSMLFPEAHIFTERALFIPKSLIAVRFT